MAALAPIAVALPFVAAAALAGASHFLPRVADDLVAVLSAVVVLGLCATLLARSAEEPLVYWFGGWQPRGHVALGIAFAIEPIAASHATIAAVLTTASLVFSWRFFDEVGTLFTVLVLVFLGALVGFAFAADLFTLFVFFELASVSAFALTGYGVSERGPIQGAFNFAITNTIGAILILLGVGLVYGRTGALNLAQVGDALSRGPLDGLVVVSFLLLTVGMLVKAGVAPFHFWLADAYAVAPVPVCVLFAGVMSDLGLLGFAKVYFEAFQGVLGSHEEALRGVLVGFGLFSAVLGAIMSLLERDLKRLLAFVTIAQIGGFLTGIGLLTPLRPPGADVSIVAEGLVRGSLFLAVGVLVYKLGSADELELHAEGRRQPLTGAVLLLGALAASGLAPFGPFLGRSLVETAGADAGYGWIAVPLAVTAGVTGAALLRAGARIFLGWGPPSDPMLTPEPVEAKREEPRAAARLSATLLLVPAAVLIAGALVLSVVPG